jgi:hypothetical protein
MSYTLNISCGAGPGLSSLVATITLDSPATWGAVASAGVDSADQPALSFTLNSSTFVVTVSNAPAFWGQAEVLPAGTTVSGTLSLSEALPLVSIYLQANGNQLQYQQTEPGQTSISFNWSLPGF